MAWTVGLAEGKTAAARGAAVQQVQAGLQLRLNPPLWLHEVRAHGLALVTTAPRER